MNEPATTIEGTTLRFEHVLPGPIETAWEYLTNPDYLEAWLARARMEPREGGWVDLMFDTDDMPERKNGGAHIVGVIDVWAPPKVVAYSWNDADHPESRTHVTFELTKEATGVRVAVTHEGLTAEAIKACGAGWHTHFSILDSVMRGQQPPAFSQLFAELQKKYG
jgi:uncharacterized protein YndB with AHSA1/START domain